MSAGRGWDVVKSAQAAAASPPAEGRSGSEAWTRLQETPRPSEVVDFPRYDAEGKPLARVRMTVLKQSELIAVSAATEKRVRAVLKSDGGSVPGTNEASRGYSDMYDNEAACQLLFRACKDEGDTTLKTPFFSSPDDVRELSTDEVGVLMNSYLEVQAALGPIPMLMGDEAYAAWGQLLAEGASALPLARLSWDERRALLMWLASQWWNSRKDTSSSGSTPESGAASADTSNEAAPA